MKIILFMLVLAFCSTTYAANDARSMRAPDGEVVSLGDPRQKVLSAFSRDRPISINNYFLDEGRNYGRATDYIYQVDNSIYTITILGERVYRITWVRR